jgi:hypothetical protein
MCPFQTTVKTAISATLLDYSRRRTQARYVAATVFGMTYPTGPIPRASVLAYKGSSLTRGGWRSGAKRGHDASHDYRITNHGGGQHDTSREKTIVRSIPGRYNASKFCSRGMCRAHVLPSEPQTYLTDAPISNDGEDGNFAHVPRSFEGAHPSPICCRHVLWHDMPDWPYAESIGSGLQGVLSDARWFACRRTKPT